MWRNNLMKKLILVVFVVFIVGCGSNTKEKQSSSPQVSSKSQQYIAQGMKFLNNKEVLKAIKSFDMAIKSDPANPENYIFLSEVYLKLKAPDRAIDTLRAATRVSPKNPEVQYLLATSLGIRWKDEDKQAAIEAAKKSVELFVQAKNQDQFKKAVVLLKSLTEKLQNK